MASVDNRVVRMEFDNAAFEARIKQTLASLSQLDKALKLDGASKGLSDVSAAAGRVNLNPLSSAVNGVSAGFLALNTVAITTLATVTQRALSAGANITKALSLDPVLDGFREYELNMGSIQTILANTRADGTGLEDVNRALDQLNEYSDKTIYNFGQMARNIGTFTAAGVELDTSVNAIKGISNLAAISGSSAEQASTAMYQLSQALSTGTLKLMDWNSVVNAGMGGEVFQKALFTTGQAMGTIANAPVGTSFEEWTAAGNSFRDSLQDGWITAEVLTNTLSGFTGDMTEAQLLAIGYTKEQAAEIIELGQVGVEAATKVRTLTGLMATLKEGIASGWAQSFRTILGDFEEATQLFTGLSNSIGGFFSRQSEARNEVLQGWADLGGRQELLQGLEQGFYAIGRVLSEVGKAFRDIFPATTSERLLELTRRFSAFTASLRPSEKTIENVRRIATGLFAALDIGWETLKAGIGFIKDLIVQLTGIGSGNFLEGTADILDFFVRLRDSLAGGAKIRVFFDNLAEAAERPIEFIRDLKDAIFDFFSSFGDTASDAGSAGIDRVEQRFESLSGVFERLGALGGVLRGALEGIATVLDTVGDAIINWFQELGDKLREAMDPGEFDAILDALNVSLLGGIGLLIANFLRGGLNFDIGDGLFSNISGAFEQLTGTLEAMQTSIKADALLKIASAVGILAASMVVLSLIDSEALTRALIAMGVGFGQLMAAFALLNRLDVGLISGATFVAISTGMVILSGAILVLSASVALLSQLGWADLAKGLIGVSVLLGVITAAAIILSKNAGSLILAAVGVSAMATALSLLIPPILTLSRLSWSELAKGMVTVAALLGVLVASGIILSKNAGSLIAAGVGLTAIAFAIGLLTASVAALSQLSLEELAKGLGSVIVLLAALTAAGIILSKNAGPLLLAGVGLVAIAFALTLLVGAISILSLLSWGDLVKGLVGVTGALLILAAASHAMNGALPGAAAILVVSIAIGFLAKALIEFSKVPAGDMIKALIGIAAALAIFGIAAALLQPVIPALLGLGAALLLIGGAFALFGVGALAVAKAFEILAEAGPDAAESIVAALEAIGQAIPALMRGVAKGVLDFIQVLADAAGPLAEAIGVILVHLLETLEDILPVVGDVILALIETILEVIVEAYPQIIEAGIGMILALLTGIRDNIGEVVALGLEILVNFLNGIANGIPQVYGAIANVIAAFIAGAATFTQNLIDAGVQILVNFLLGISNNLHKITEAVGVVITTFITDVGNLGTSIADAGTNALVNFLSGITNNLILITNTVTTMITTFINGVSNSIQRIIASGANAIINFITGLGHHAGRIVAAGVTVIIRFLEGVSGQAIRLANAAADILIDFLNALAVVIEEKSGELRQAGINIATAIADGITGGLASKAKGLAESAVGTASGAVGAVTDFLGISSPSKVFYEIGQNMVDGMANGLSDYGAAVSSSRNMADASVEAVRTILSRIADEISTMDDFVSPVITPVLDMDAVNRSVDDFKQAFAGASISGPSTSYVTAQSIAKSPSPVGATSSDEASSRGGVSFVQNNYSPEPLSTSDIYKKTRNQLTLAKEELDVP